MRTIYFYKALSISYWFNYKIGISKKKELFKQNIHLWRDQIAMQNLKFDLSRKLRANRTNWKMNQMINVLYWLYRNDFVLLISIFLYYVYECGEIDCKLETIKKSDVSIPLFPIFEFIEDISCELKIVWLQCTGIRVCSSQAIRILSHRFKIIFCSKKVKFKFKFKMMGIDTALINCNSNTDEKELSWDTNESEGKNSNKNEFTSIF